MAAAETLDPRQVQASREIARAMDLLESAHFKLKKGHATSKGRTALGEIMQNLDKTVKSNAELQYDADAHRKQRDERKKAAESRKK